MSDSLHERAEALENGFFAHRDQELLAKLREEMKATEIREALSSASGIADTATLDALVEHNIQPQTLLAIGMIPLVSVAWSSGAVEDAERTAILQAADIAGIDQGSASYELLQDWLKRKPGDDLLDAWKSYIATLATSVDASALEQIRDRVMDRAERVAAAAGGFLGLGSKISDSEQKVIDDLAQTFAKTA